MRTSLLTDNSRNALVKKEIINLCIKNGKDVIANFSNVTGVSVPTITKFVGEMIDDGYLQDEGKISTSGGRRPTVFGLNPNAGYFVGIDVARQHFHIAICNFKGELVHFIQDIEFVLVANPDSFKNLCAIVKDEVGKAGLKWEKVLGVGISLSGRVNPEAGYSLSYFVSDDLPIKDIFEREFNVPVNIENDSRAMTYGEYINMGENAPKNVIFVNIGWGLGMGLILDGKLYYGKSGFSGEIGHVPLMNNDIICRCGKVGCLETGASGSALYRMIMKMLNDGRTSSLSGLYRANGDLKLHEILEAVEKEDMLAIEGIEEVGANLGRGISGLINIFNPSLVVIGGRLIVGGEYLLLPIRSAINKYSLSKVSSDTKLEFSKLGQKAASIGDCLLCRGKLLGIV